MTTTYKLNRAGDVEVVEITRHNPPLSPFHSWLLRQRIYCEKCSTLEKATTVIHDGHTNKDVCLCDFHVGK